MSFINLIVDSLACLAAIVVLSILGVLLGVLLCKLKNIIKDKVQQIKIKQYAVTYLIEPKRGHISNKNDDDIQILTFGTYQSSTRTEFFKARSKSQAIAKFYTNSNDRTFKIRNYGDVLVVAVNEITFVK